MPNPGKLSTILIPKRKLLLKQKSSGKYDHEVFAAHIKSFFATLDPKIANNIFKTAVEKNYLPNFKNCAIVEKEKAIEGYGKIDFIVQKLNKEYVEVKSCTHVENGAAKFPDRPTERGRRHLSHLINFAKQGKKSHLVIVIQRPDAVLFKPFKEVDPKFSALFKKAIKSRVNIHIISTEFNPQDKTIYLVNSDIPYEI